jgi:hypothetical protein
MPPTDVAGFKAWLGRQDIYTACCSKTEGDCAKAAKTLLPYPRDDEQTKVPCCLLMLIAIAQTGKWNNRNHYAILVPLKDGIVIVDPTMEQFRRGKNGVFTWGEWEVAFRIAEIDMGGQGPRSWKWYHKDFLELHSMNGDMDSGTAWRTKNADYLLSHRWKYLCEMKGA